MACGERRQTRDEAYVKEICGRLGIPLAVAHENVAEYAAARGISGEEAGRILRYEHMKETAEQFSCQKTATAHHRDDSAETVLFNMFRGSGLKGLSGIRPVRGEVIRPLLCLSVQRSPDIWRREGSPGARIPPMGKMCIQETGSATSFCPG